MIELDMYLTYHLPPLVIILAINIIPFDWDFAFIDGPSLIDSTDQHIEEVVDLAFP